MFAALSDKEQYWKERINMFIALAPVLIPNKNNLLFDIAAKNSKILEQSLAMSNIWELFGSNWAEQQKIVKMVAPSFTKAALN